MNAIIGILISVLIVIVIWELVTLIVLGKPILEESFNLENACINPYDNTIISFSIFTRKHRYITTSGSILFKYYISYYNGSNRTVWRYSKLSKQIDNHYKQLKHETN